MALRLGAVQGGNGRRFAFGSVLLFLFVCIGLYGTPLGSPGDSTLFRAWSHTETIAPCRPFEEPGWLQVNHLEPLEAKWTSLTNCTAPTNWIADLADLIQSVPESIEADHLQNKLDWLQNQTLLWVGDSTDRYALDGLSLLLYDREAMMTSIAHPEEEGQDPTWTTHQSPRYIHVPQLDLRFINFFQWGLQTDGYFHNGVWPYTEKGMCDCVGANRFENLTDESLIPMVERLTRPPTLIIYQTMEWDLQHAHATATTTEGRIKDEPLSLDIVKTYKERLQEAIAHLRLRFPQVPIIFRGGYLAMNSNEVFRSYTREHQLILAQEAAMQLADVPYIPMSRILAGFWDQHHEAQRGLHLEPKASAMALIWPILDHLHRSISDQGSSAGRTRHGRVRGKLKG